MTRWFLIVLAAAWCAFPAETQAQHKHHGHGAKKAATCVGAGLNCANVATPTFAPDGTLWLVWAVDDRVMVSRSTDQGRSFAPATDVTGAPLDLDRGADSRPRIVVDRAGRVIVSYTIFKREGFIGQVMMAHSADGGATFTAPRPVAGEGAGQRFETIGLDPGGRLFAAWIDKRNAFAAKEAGREYPGAALVFAWSDDAGTSFSTTRVAQENSCECCRLGFSFTASGQPVVLFRNIFEGMVRDHAIVTFTGPTPGPVHRVSVDNWAIEACPHHGPSLTISADGAYHAAWFTEGTVRQGLFYARTTDGGRTFSAPMPIGDADRQPSRPQLLAVQDVLWMAWKEFDGERTTVMIRSSHDSGSTWSPPRVAAEAADHSDHPLLVSDGRRAFLSWQAQVEGYRLLPLEGAL